MMRIGYAKNKLFKIVLSGQTNPDIYRRLNDTWVLCSQTPFSRSGASSHSYLISANRPDGSRGTYYAHMLVAEAFVDNPENHKYIDALDGDYANTRPPNLEWVSRKEQSRRARARGKYQYEKYPCRYCGQLITRRKNAHTACRDCRCKHARELNAAHRVDRRIEALKHIDLSVITTRQRHYIEERLKGLTYSEIADKFGVSNQSVSRAIKRAEEKNKESKRGLS